MATPDEIRLELEALARRVHAGKTLTARERRRFRKLAVRAGLKDDHRLLSPQHRPLFKNIWRYEGVDAEEARRSRSASRRSSGRGSRI